MSEVEGTRTFAVAGAAYDSFMGRYSRALALPFADAAGVQVGQSAVDVGCGPGALTGELVARLGAASVAACDPAPGFVDECAARHPGVRVGVGRAEDIPFGDHEFDHAMAQLVYHFVSDAPAATQEMLRVVRPGGRVAACVWDFAHGMEMLRGFWDAAMELEPGAPGEAQTLRFGGPNEIVDVFRAAGMTDVHETMLTVTSAYSGFDELWNGFLLGVGPAGAYCVSLPDDRRAMLREALFRRMGEPPGPFELRAAARCAVGTKPG